MFPSRSQKEGEICAVDVGLLGHNNCTLDLETSFMTTDVTGYSTWSMQRCWLKDGPSAALGVHEACRQAGSNLCKTSSVTLSQPVRQVFLHRNTHGLSTTRVSGSHVSPLLREAKRVATVLSAQAASAPQGSKLKGHEKKLHHVNDSSQQPAAATGQA